jgi:hypothetical protein
MIAGGRHFDEITLEKARPAAERRNLKPRKGLKFPIDAFPSDR